MIFRTTSRLVFSVFLVVTGCVTTEEEWGKVRTVGEQRTGFDLDWDMGGEDGDPIVRRVNELLDGGLTGDEAVQVALLNNKILQAEFERIGVAKAEYVQASLLSNPSLGLDMRFPTGGGFATVEGGLIWNVADLWIVPIEKKWRAYDLEATLAAVNEQVIQTAAMAKRAYVNLQTTVELRAFVAKHLALYEEFAEQISYRYQFGLHDDFDRYMAEADLHQQQIDLARLDAQSTQARAHLNTVMALLPKQYEYTFAPDDLGIRIPQVRPLDAVPYAYEHVFELQVREMQVLSAAFRVDLEKARIFDIVRLGLAYEQAQGQEVGMRREGTDYETLDVSRVHERAYGLAASIELPVFDQNQAQIAKAKFQLRQSKKLMMVMKAQIRERMFDDIARIQFNAAMVRTYRDEIEPRMVDAMAYSNRYFDAMRMNVFFYLRSVDRLIRSHRAYLHGMRDLRHAIIDLELHLGGRIPDDWYGTERVTFHTPQIAVLEPGSPAPDEPSQWHDSGRVNDVQGFSHRVRVYDDHFGLPAELQAGILGLRFSNEGTAPRTVRINGPQVDESLESPLAPGETRVLWIQMRPGRYELTSPAAGRAMALRHAIEVTAGQRSQHDFNSDSDHRMSPKTPSGVNTR